MKTKQNKKTILLLLIVPTIFIIMSLLVSAQTYYCTLGNEFVTDLDSEDQQTCEAAGFNWTGNYCCSENDDPNEYYNDPNGRGGCWNKEFVLAGDLAPGRQDIINIDGVFYGCKLNDNDNVLTILDQQANSQQTLIENAEYCFQDPQNLIICAFNNTWQLSDGDSTPQLSQVPSSFDEYPSAACCPENRCWDGTQCLESQASNPRTNPTNGFRCVDGNWNQADLKLTPNNAFSGYCPNNNQCLFNLDGQFSDNNNPNGNPQCISNDQYKDDNYCENGDWSSRTKFVALKLFEIVENQNEYILFCDDAENTLNNLNYVVGGETARNLVNEENANNFCVLSSNNKIIFGTSLNKNLSIDNSFLNAIGISGCNVINDDRYHPCINVNGNNDKAWYNDKLQIILYSNQEFSIGQTTQQTVFGILVDFVRDFFKTVTNLITGGISTHDESSFVNELKKFDRLYLSKTSNKEIKGTVESAGFSNKTLAIEYTNFITDICSFISDFESAQQDDPSVITCTASGSTQYVFAEGSALSNIKPGEIWYDLTSKLRIS